MTQIIDSSGNTTDTIEKPQVYIEDLIGNNIGRFTIEDKKNWKSKYRDKIEESKQFLIGIRP